MMKFTDVSNPQLRPVWMTDEWLKLHIDEVKDDVVMCHETLGVILACSTRRLYLVGCIKKKIRRDCVLVDRKSILSAAAVATFGTKPEPAIPAYVRPIDPNEMWSMPVPESLGPALGYDDMVMDGGGRALRDQLQGTAKVDEIVLGETGTYSWEAPVQIDTAVKENIPGITVTMTSGSFVPKHAVTSPHKQPQFMPRKPTGGGFRRDIVVDGSGKRRW